MKLDGTRTTLAWAAAALLCAGPVYAQTEATPPPPQTAPDGQPAPPPYGGPHHGGPERRIEMLQRHLDLTPDQTTQVKALFATERTKMEALHGNTALSPDDRRSQMMAIHQDSETKLRALLTPDQVTKYDAMQAHMRERREGGGPPQGAPPPPPPGF